MGLEEVRSEVPLKVTPDSVRVTGIILSIVILKQKLRGLDAVIVTGSGLGAAHPGEAELAAIAVEGGFGGGGEVGAIAVDVFFDDLPELGALGVVEGAGRDAGGREGLDADFLGGEEFGRGLAGDDGGFLLIWGKARSSSEASARRPARGPSLTSPGLAPRKLGVRDTVASAAMVKLRERWWPSKRQPQAWPALGSPKMAR